MRFVLVVGTTQTAQIPGISAAGGSPELLATTPSADAELLVYGEPVRSGIVPVSPSGCPTPAVVTRAVREILNFEVTVLDAGLSVPTGAPTVSVGASPGEDIRQVDPVPCAEDVFAEARHLGRSIPDEELVIGEAIPGGTTTALGVLTALGERESVSSSLAENPLSKKRNAVETGLETSNLEAGDAAESPGFAVEQMGDPMLAVASGLTVGALESGTEVTLAGGTQLLAAAALVRHAGVNDPLRVATTAFVANDETAAVEEIADDLNVDLAVTDPGFERGNHVAFERFLMGEAKEGVGMGGALWLAERAGVSMDTVRDRIVDVYARVVGDES